MYFTYRLQLLALCSAAFILLLTGCGSQAAPPSSAPASQAATSQQGTTSQGAAPQQTTGGQGSALQPTPTLQPTSTAVPAASSKTNSAPTGLFLNVTSPAESGTLNTADLPVTGKTIAGAVVSVDGNLVPVGSDGTFSTQVKLNQGPNDVEVVASDRQGNEKSVIRSVIYAP